MPSKYCKECSIKLGMFKKKLQCQKCLSHFCQSCSNSIKHNENTLHEILVNLSGFNCLSCVVLTCSVIRKENLFLLSRKHLSEFLHGNNISMTGCREKNDLIDLVIEHAKVNNIISRHDLAEEHRHNRHLDRLRENAELWRQQEQERQQQNGQSSSNSDNAQQNNGNITEDTFLSPNATIETNIDSVYQQPVYQQPVHQQPVYQQPVHQQPVYQQNRNNDTNTSNTSPRIQTETDNTQQDEPFTERHGQAQASSAHLSTTDDSKRRKWKSMDDINDEEEISQLSVFELKQVLTANFIDYKGCCEKKELIDKVKMLYQSCQNGGAMDTQGHGEAYEKDVCKICMDRIIDCVLLDCGHLVSCVKCGKRLNECPICRQLVVRVVHIFRV